MIEPTPEPKPNFNTFDAVMLIVGIVIGAGIFALPPLVAANTGTAQNFLLAWLAGGVVSLGGALCYAELATTYPHSGGEHHFLRRAFGGTVGFLFAWSRMTVLQTGSIAIQAYIVGDYLARWLPAGAHGAEMIAGIAVIGITAINLGGLRLGNRTQVVLGLATCLALLMVAGAGLFDVPGVTSASAAPPGGGGTQTPAFGLAMVFVLLAFGGWNEAAYVSADVARRNLVRALLWGIGTITLIYLLVNWAYLRGLGIAGLAASKAPAAELVQRMAGAELAAFTSLAIVIAALSTMNATAITGARSNFALGRDVALFQALGKCNAETNTPRNALLVQGAIALGLVILGALSRNGFTALIEYTAPVFWFFFFLVGASLFVLRRNDGARPRVFRVPLYPLTPLIFCGVCLAMIRSSLAHTGFGALVGVAVLIAGLPVLWLARSRSRAAALALLNQEQIRS
jgi:amino acid transporter